MEKFCEDIGVEPENVSAFLSVLGRFFYLLQAGPNNNVCLQQVKITIGQVKILTSRGKTTYYQKEARILTSKRGEIPTLKRGENVQFFCYFVTIFFLYFSRESNLYVCVSPCGSAF